LCFPHFVFSDPLAQRLLDHFDDFCRLVFAQGLGGFQPDAPPLDPVQRAALAPEDLSDLATTSTLR